jgi:hypothetical protein
MIDTTRDWDLFQDENYFTHERYTKRLGYIPHLTTHGLIHGVILYLS